VNKRDATGDVAEWDRWCKGCRREYQRTGRAAKERRKRDNIRRQAAHARRRERMATDPEYAASERAKWARRGRRWRHANPERARAQAKRYREKLKRDPVRLRRHRENERIAYRLRRERQVGRLGERQRQEGQRDEANATLPMLPARPLAEAVERVIAARQAVATNGEGDEAMPAEGREQVCETLGITDRALFDWKTGRRRMVRSDTADRVLVRSGLLWFDVWSPEQYPDVARRLEATLHG
jgi:hypothetical protein